MDQVLFQAAAREARKTELKIKLAKLQGRSTGQVESMTALSTSNQQLQQEIADLNQQILALETGDARGETEEFGWLTVVDLHANNERTAGQTAVVMLIKTNPETTEDEAIAAWSTAATAYRQSIGRQLPLHAPHAILEEYALNLVDRGVINEPSWRAFRDWVYVTPPDQLA